MPSAPQRFCVVAGCPEKVTTGRCPTHHHAQRQIHQRHYTGTPGLNYGRRWGRARAAHLIEHPFCVACEQVGDTRLADELDHVIPHRGDKTLFWDATNWAGLCKAHHAAKTAREVGLGSSGMGGVV